MNGALTVIPPLYPSELGLRYYVYPQYAFATRSVSLLEALVAIIDDQQPL